MLGYIGPLKNVTLLTRGYQLQLGVMFGVFVVCFCLIVLFMCLCCFTLLLLCVRVLLCSVVLVYFVWAVCCRFLLVSVVGCSYVSGVPVLFSDVLLAKPC